MNKKIITIATTLMLATAMANVVPFMASADNPVPVITSISPSSVAAGSSDITLNVYGSDFLSTSVIYFNGASKPTVFDSSSHVSATIPAGNLAASGNYSVNVLNPIPGGGFSNSATFTVTPLGNPVPGIVSISPSSKTAGETSFTMTIYGSNFIAGSMVRLDNSPRATTYLSPSQLNAFIPSSDMTVPASHTIAVVNPTPQGGTSNQVTFTVNPSSPSPVITSVSPSQINAGGSSFTLTVNGFNFVATNTPSIVRINGSDRSTTIVSANQLQATIPSSDISSSGTLNVTVYNPGPNNQGVSNTATVAVNPMGFPVISSIAPSTKVVGSSSFTLTVNGANFVPGSLVRFNGLPRTTSYVSANTVTAQILASDLAHAGNNTVTVTNPNGNVSNNAIFAISDVPGLPNTGIGPSDSASVPNVGLNVLAGISALLALSVCTFAFARIMRKKNAHG